MGADGCVWGFARLNVLYTRVMGAELSAQLIPVHMMLITRALGEGNGTIEVVVVGRCQWSSDQ